MIGTALDSTAGIPIGIVLSISIKRKDSERPNLLKLLTSDFKTESRSNCGYLYRTQGQVYRLYIFSTIPLLMPVNRLICLIDNLFSFNSFMYARGQTGTVRAFQHKSRCP